MTDKKEKRKAIIIEKDFLYAICVFRGQFLEHLFLDINKDKLIETFETSSVYEEVHEIEEDIQLKTICETIIDRLSQKINKIKT